MFGRKLKSITPEEFEREEKIVAPISAPTKEILKLIKEVEQPKKSFPLARVHAIEQISDGIFKYTLITNNIFANVGDEFEI